MSSRRKSSNPCMVRVVNDLPEEQQEPEEAVDMERSADQSESSQKIQVDQQEETPESQTETSPEENQNSEPSEQEEQLLEDGKPPTIEDAESTDKEEGGGDSEPESQQKPVREYECKYCPFVTQNLNDFKDHVDSSHPYVILNPLYLCAPCNFNTKKFDSLSEHNSARHPGETNFKFKRIKTNNQTVLEQTIESKDKSAESEVGDGHGESSAGEVLRQGRGLKSSLDGLIQKDQITAVNINGTVIIPEPTILQGLSHVTPLLQLPPNLNSVPKIAVPLNTTKYNPSLDDNLTLITSFNKFPYPTHAELSWLTAASKHPEEQIKVWFTTQRLKQGITWSPEEVEEARKKMFNGSIPPNHHMFTSQPSSPISVPSTKVSKQPVVHTTVEHPGQVRTVVSNGIAVGIAGTNSSAAAVIGSCHTLKRPLQSHMSATFGPESKRPIMAVAPHPGEPKDRGLMAPPPPPPPPKDQSPKEMKRPVAVPLVSSEVKRPPPAVPLLPPSPSSPSLLSKGKTLPTLGNTKTKPLVSLPSIVFPESLTRPMIAPPPIFGPPFKNSLLIPRHLPQASKEKNPLNSPGFSASDLKVQNSPPHVAPQIRRPAVIQSVHPPSKIAAPLPGFPLEGNKGLEQHGADLKTCYNRGDQVLTPLTEANGTSLPDSDWVHNNGVVHLDGDEPHPDFQQKSSVLTQFPLLERMKGKTAEQLKILEENFLRNSFPTHSEVDNLSASTRLSHQEIESWFVERRALRDNLEQALLNSMGTKRNGAGGLVASVEKQLQQTVKLNGIQKPSAGIGHLKAAAPPKQRLPMVPTPSSNINSCLVPPDGRWLALLKGDIAQTRWPSPEEFSHLEGRTGLTRTDLAHWFNESRLQTDSSVDLSGLFHGSVMNGGQRASLRPSEKTPSSNVLQCQGGAITNNVSSSSSSSSSKATELELGWPNGQRFSSLSAHQLKDIHGRFSGRCDFAANDAPAGLLQKEGK